MDYLTDEKLSLLDAMLAEDGTLPALAEEDAAGGEGIARREPGDAVPLSFAQARLWLLHQIDAESPAYHVPFAVRVRGDLDVAVLRRVFTAIAERHEILRTTFRMGEDGEPVQEIAAPAAVELPVVDLGGAPDPADAELSRLREHARLPFDPATGPLWRTLLLRRGAREHVLAVTFHHLVFDGWSVGVVLEEVARLYEAFTTGAADPLPPLPLQYADYAVWQRADGRWRDGLEYWRRRLQDAPQVLALPTDRPRPVVPTHRGGHVRVEIPGDLAGRAGALAAGEHATVYMVLLAAFQALLARYSGSPDILVGSPVAGRGQQTRNLLGCFINMLVMRTDVSAAGTFRELLRSVRETALEAQAHQDVPFEQVVDAVQPDRDLSHGPLFQAMFVLHERGRAEPWLPGMTLEPIEVDAGTAKFDIELDLWDRPEGLSGWLEYNADLFEAASAERMAGHLVTLLRNLVDHPDQPLTRLDLVDDAERDAVLTRWNDTAYDYDQDAVVHRLIADQAARTPEAVALIDRDRELTYADLDARANRLAHRLREHGVGPETLVGVCADRSAELVAGLLAVLKAGGAYVPLDPEYPAERLAFMISDARPVALLVDRAGERGLADTGAGIPRVDLHEVGGGPDTEPAGEVGAERLAYVIYTSGSTGRPKGVMIEHRQVVNFFTAMDERIGVDGPARWLALTSVSFDISVLELLWTLSRGHTVVVGGGRDESLLPLPPASLARTPEFSLFYFASDDGDADRYALLLDGARFADRNGFAAVWTPERHFHSFGGLYPNPAVTSAALAMVTERLRIRAGSVVLPLHHPVRVAEEWSVIDNLSGGRTGVSFASGWHADDFVFAPDAYADRRDQMFESVEIVRRLWRGEAVELAGGTGRPVPVRIRPRPVQPELPVWITAAGSPGTFARAGEMGANLLTHLLGQDVTELAGKIEMYRQARRRTHGDDGHVTLMLHTFVGPDAARVRETIREPFSRYLRDSVDLLRGFAAGTGMDVSPEMMSEADLDALVRHAFDRYVESSGLFGTVETAVDMVERLAAIGVDEVACLIDFGVEPRTVLDHLPFLAQVGERAAERRRERAAAAERSVPALIARHGVTHLQCTPSLLRVLVDNEEACAALGGLDTLLVGGEAFPADLAARLPSSPRVLNMYGPTETTIWSSTCDLADTANTAGPARVGGPGALPLGAPVANTQIVLLDEHGSLVPVGVPGEVHIGGDGVARGYLGRPELTAERFVSLPVAGGRRFYRTGDLARRRADGTLEFLGRRDHQVKIRGHRVEPAEIEEALTRHPAVRSCLVAARQDGRDGQQLVAYAVPNGPLSGSTLTAGDLRSFLRDSLPAHLVPSLFVLLDAFPLTPNGKIDRNALPAPVAERRSSAGGDPRDATEAALAKVWADVLGLDGVDVGENFFDLGGDSIQVIQVVDRVNRQGLRLTPRLLFQNPTIAELARAMAAPRADVRIDAQQDAVSGEAPLTPVQRWLLEQDLPEPWHYNHAMMLQVPRPLEPNALADAVAHLLRHHDALRMRFTRADSGWRQWLPAEHSGPIPVHTVSLRGVPEQEQRERIEAESGRLQASLDLESGPLLRVCVFTGRAAGPDLLLIVAHHLVVDGVSGRLLVEDLWAAYERLERREPVDLPAKTTSFVSWARRLREYARRPELAAEAPAWLRLADAATSPLPRDRDDRDGRGTEDSERHVAVSLTPEETDAVLQGRQPDAVLLATLGRAVGRWSGRPEVLVDLEGHGRADLFEDVDLSRTVGWFTAVHPVLVPADGPVVETAERLGAVPGDGLGFGLLQYLGPDEALRDRLRALPRAEIIVNYLGRFDRSLGPFTLASEPLGPYRGPHGMRSHLLVVNGYVSGGSLQVDWAYSEQIHDEATVRAVAEDFADGLRRLAEGRA